MKPTIRFAVAIAFCLFLFSPFNAKADNMADELMDSTHDLRAQVDLTEEFMPSWEAPVADSWSVVNGGSPFSQSTMPVTIDDNTPGLDIGSLANYSLRSLEDISSN